MKINTINIIGVAAILLSVNLFPNYPYISIDSSWMTGIKLALDQGMVPGYDVLFTYGPLANIITGYFGEKFIINFLLSIIIAFNLSILLIGILNSYFLIVAAYIFILAPNNEAILFCYLAVFPFAVIKEDSLNYFYKLNVNAALILMPLLCLAKLSFFPITSLLLLVYSFYQGYKNKYKKILFSWGVFALSLLIYWNLSGYEASNILKYFSGNAEIISGYTTAMEWDFGIYLFGFNVQLIETVILYLFLLAIIYYLLTGDLVRCESIYLIFSVGAVLAVTFKAGIVRHGGVHSIYPWIILTLTYLIMRESNNKLIFKSILVASLLITVILSPIYGEGGHALQSIISEAKSYSVSKKMNWEKSKKDISFWSSYLNEAPAKFLTSLPSPFVGLTERIDDISKIIYSLKNYGLDQRDILLEESKSKLRDECQLPTVFGSVDIYPDNINCIWSSNLQWKPRPIFQSYSAYTESLQLSNKNFLQSDKSPENILITVGPIDGRLPAIEDGSNWLCIAQLYESNGSIAGGYLPLKRTNHNKCDYQYPYVSKKVQLGDNVELSCDDNMIVADFRFNSNLLGRLSSLVYKNRRLEIDLETCDGSKHSYKFIPTMSSLPFPVSPLVENVEHLDEFMFSSETSFNRRLSKFSIRYAQSESPIRGWSDFYNVRIYDLTRK